MRLISDLFDAQKKISWRRLAVFVCASVFLGLGVLGEWAWVSVAGLFIASEASQAVASKIASRTPTQSPTADPPLSVYPPGAVHPPGAVVRGGGAAAAGEE